MDELKRLAAQMQRVEHFRHLAASDLVAIVASGRIRHFCRGECVFAEGDPSAGMHVLLRGQVRLMKAGPQGQIGILSVVKPIIMFNEVALLDGGPNPCSAEATEDSETWQISSPAFHTLVQRYPQLGLGLLKVLARRNRQMISRIEDISFRPVLARVAKLLLDLSRNGEQTILRRHLPLEDMAAHVASVPEAVSRALNTLKSQGVIECDRAEIVVKAPGTLSLLAELTPELAQD